MLHVVGDAAVAAALSALEASGGPDVWRPLRPRFEHADGLAPDLVARAAALGVTVVQNPSHFTLPELMFARFGYENMAGFQPMKSLCGRSASGDRLRRPTEPVAEHPVRGDPSHSRREALTREQAVAAYTRGSAFAELAETEKARSRPGCWPTWPCSPRTCSRWRKVACPRRRACLPSSGDGWFTMLRNIHGKEPPVTAQRGVFDFLRSRGEEFLTQISNELLSNPRFLKAMQAAMRGKEWVDEAVAQALRTMNVPTRTEFKRAVARIEALESELAETQARGGGGGGRRALRARPAAPGARRRRGRREEEDGRRRSERAPHGGHRHRVVPGIAGAAAPGRDRAGRKPS